jgi:hypothetical protein
VHSESCIRLRIGGLTRESGARTRTGVLSGTGTDRSDVLQSESARSETNATLMKSYFFLLWQSICSNGLWEDTGSIYHASSEKQWVYMIPMGKFSHRGQ